MPSLEAKIREAVDECLTDLTAHQRQAFGFVITQNVLKVVEAERPTVTRENCEFLAYMKNANDVAEWLTAAGVAVVDEEVSGE